MTKMTPSASGETDESVRVALPLGREHMPTDYSISLAAYTGRGTGHEVRIPDDLPQIPQQKPSVNLVNFAVPTTRPATSNVNINFITSPKHSRKSCRLNRFFGFVNASQCQGHDCKSAGGKFLEGVRLVTCT